MMFCVCIARRSMTIYQHLFYPRCDSLTITNNENWRHSAPRTRFPMNYWILVAQVISLFIFLCVRFHTILSAIGVVVVVNEFFHFVCSRARLYLYLRPEKMRINIARVSHSIGDESNT